MKPQRSFVVERKFSRRRPKSQTTSMWGDADLKALAREVELETAGSFADQKPYAPVATNSKLVEEVAQVAEPASPGVTRTDEPIETASSVAPPSLTPSVKARRSSRKVTATKPQFAIHSKTAPQSVRELKLVAVMSFDALMELDEENRMLRARWRKRIEVEHAQLVQMRERINLRTEMRD